MIKEFFQKSKNQKNTLDYDFFRAIQPIGNMKFDERHILKGNGYETCLHVYAYPESAELFWLEDLTSIENAICTIDLKTYDKEEAKKDIDKTMKEDNYQYAFSTSHTDSIDSSQSIQNLHELYSEISTDGEIVKLVHARIFASAPTLDKLEETVTQIITELESRGYRISPFLNEMEYEWRSMFQPYSEQELLPNSRMGNPIPAKSIAAGYPFNYLSLSDPFGTYLGYVPNGGTVVFSLYHNDLLSDITNKYRNCYDAFICGKKGSGKSTLLKKLMLTSAIKNDFIRGIAVSSEFDYIVKKLSGKMISMDGSGGILNLLDVQRSANDETTNFTTHLSKLNTIYRYLSPNSPDSEVTEFENLCRELYIGFGLWSNDAPRAISGLAPLRYPIFSDLLNLCNEQLYSDYEKKIIRDNLTPGRTERLEHIVLILEDIVYNYGHIFNGHTSFPDIDNEQIVFFDIRNLTSMKREIFNVQMFNILSLFWSTMLDKGLPMKDRWDKKSIKFEDIIHSLLIIDEAHLLINSGNIRIIKYLQSFLRETRKYFSALVFATQSIRDVVPESASAEMLDELKVLFELTQYKFILQQDSSAIPLIDSIFGTGSLSKSDLNSIPNFAQGECILHDGKKSLRFQIEINEEERSLYRGGA